jgi:hypothetical protein
MKSLRSAIQDDHVGIQLPTTLPDFHDIQFMPENLSLGNRLKSTAMVGGNPRPFRTGPGLGLESTAISRTSVPESIRDFDRRIHI